MLDGSAIAAILTGVLALIGAVATAWMSGWNEKRKLQRENSKALARYAVPLLNASWDLAHWLGDILEEENYSPERCQAFGDGWSSQFTSFLIGQYFAGVYILREKTHFLAHMRGEKVEALKKLLWKINDEFISMHYTERETLEMRWFEGDILAVQEHMTEVCDLDGDGNSGEMRSIGWVEFQEKYPKKDPRDKDSKGVNLRETFGKYESQIQRIIYRRFKSLYATKWTTDENPQGYDKLVAASKDEEYIEKLKHEEELIERDHEINPDYPVVVPDHRIRRLQHLLSSLIELLDEVSTMRFKRPVDRCAMQLRDSPERVPCDCNSPACNPEKQNFAHRRLHGWTKSGRYERKTNLRKSASLVQTWPDATSSKAVAVGEKMV